MGCWKAIVFRTPAAIRGSVERLEKQDLWGPAESQHVAPELDSLSLTLLFSAKLTF